MNSIISHIRSWRHAPLAAAPELPDAYEAFAWDHDPDPLNWPADERAEYSGYVHAFAFLAGAAQRKTGGRR
jgi:hypothetical protein